MRDYRDLNTIEYACHIDGYEHLEKWKLAEINNTEFKERCNYMVAALGKRHFLVLGGKSEHLGPYNTTLEIFPTNDGIESVRKHTEERLLQYENTV